MPRGYGVGDHCLFVMDLQEASLIGEVPFHVQQFTSRQLNTKVSSRATWNYLARLEASLAQHRLIECMGKLHKTSRSKKAFLMGDEQTLSGKHGTNG
jgi:hypothetical protein